MDSSATNAQCLQDLMVFLKEAPQMFSENDQIKRFTMANGSSISCILWKGVFHITGTDIVKILLFRFAALGRQVLNVKKFEEGVFSDLRNLKSGMDATLEEPRSEFLEFLFKNGCIRTQKKQKVFYWCFVPHERLFVDALERDLKREHSLFSINSIMANLGLLTSGNSPVIVPPFVQQPPNNMLNYSLKAPLSSNPIPYNTSLPQVSTISAPAVQPVQKIPSAAAQKPTSPSKQTVQNPPPQFNCDDLFSSDFLIEGPFSAALSSDVSDFDIPIAEELFPEIRQSSSKRKTENYDPLMISDSQSLKKFAIDLDEPLCVNPAQILANSRQ